MAKTQINPARCSLSQVRVVLDEIPGILEGEEALLRGIHGRCVWGTRITGLAARREAHVVFAIASALRVRNYLVTLDDGYESPQMLGEHRRRNDLAIRLPTTR